MSRSQKKPIIKDKGYKKIYHRICKRNVRNYLNSHKDDLENIIIPNFKSIVNDYDYCDYKIDLRFKNKNNQFNKYKRK